MVVLLQKRCLGLKRRKLLRIAKALHKPVRVSAPWDYAEEHLLGTGSFGRVVLGDDGAAYKWALVTGKVSLRELLMEVARARGLPRHPQLILPRTCAQLVNMLPGYGYGPGLYCCSSSKAVLGGTLAGEVKSFQEQRESGRAPSQRAAKRLLAQLVGLTRIIHKAGLVHRDLKPRNILMAETSPVLHLVDWGAATHVGCLYNEKRKNDVICTARYAPPELLDPRHAVVHAQPAEDMFSVGVIVYELLAGSGSHPLVSPERMAVCDAADRVTSRPIRRPRRPKATPPPRAPPQPAAGCCSPGPPRTPGRTAPAAADMLAGGSTPGCGTPAPRTPGALAPRTPQIFTPGHTPKPTPGRRHQYRDAEGGGPDPESDGSDCSWDDRDQGTSAAGSVYSRMLHKSMMHGQLQLCPGGVDLLPAKYDSAWLTVLQGLCMVQPSLRWGYEEVLRSPLFSLEELGKWADSAESGAQKRNVAGDNQEADALISVARLYRSMQADKLALLQPALIDALVAQMHPLSLAQQPASSMLFSQPLAPLTNAPLPPAPLAKGLAQDVWGQGKVSIMNESVGSVAVLACSPVSSPVKGMAD